MKKIAFTIFPMLFCIQFSFAQEDDSNSVSITPIEGGKLFSPSANKPIGTFYGAEVGYQISTANNQSDWVSMLNVQDISIVGSYLNMHNILFDGVPASKGSLGSLYGITNRLDMRICRIGQSNIIFRPGIGFEYVTQTYGTDGNLIFGSHINFAAVAGIGAEVYISQSLKLKLMLEADHFSDAYFKGPNASVDIIIASAGFIKNIEYEEPLYDQKSFGNKSGIEFEGNVGRRGYIMTGYFYNQHHIGMYLTDSAAKKEGTSNLYIFEGYVGYNYALNSVFSLKAGVDGMYYTHPFTYANFFKTYEDWNSSYIPLTIAINIGGEMSLGRLAFAATYGHYVHSDFLDPAVHSYWTFGPKYSLTDWLAMNAKVHFHGIESGYADVGFVVTVN